MIVAGITASATHRNQSRRDGPALASKFGPATKETPPKRGFSSNEQRRYGARMRSKISSDVLQCQAGLQEGSSCGYGLGAGHLVYRIATASTIAVPATAPTA